jgi:hypothetical protein
MNNAITTFELLKRVFNHSTPSMNLFAAAIARIVWDSTYEEDGETYYNVGGFTLITASTNPFKLSKDNHPVALFPNGELIRL